MFWLGWIVLLAPVGILAGITWWVASWLTHEEHRRLRQDLRDGKRVI